MTVTDNGWILVIGATGNQGGSTVRYLLEAGWTVHALTRDPASPAAAKLRASGVTVVPGDLDDTASLRSAVDGAYGVFSVQTPLGPGGVPAEERHGTRLADVVAEVGVGHYVHSSVGGAENPAGVHWRESKLRIEERIREHGLPATFVRPTYFMNNLDQYPPLLENGELVYRRALEPGRALQMIDCQDIGFFVAEAFAHPETAVGARIEIAGDELTGEQIARVFEQHTGIPTRYVPVPLEELRAVSEWQATAYTWLNRIGYTADIPALRSRFPGLTDLAGWLEKSGWRSAGHHGAPPAAGVPRAG